MQEFNIELPSEVLTPGKHTAIDFSSLEGKIIIGLMGYAKSGKDFITRTFIDDYGYKRVAFADNIKKEMNTYLKEAVLNDINQRERMEVDSLRDGGTFVDYVPYTIDDMNFFTEDLALKKVLRPYIIWYGEKLRNINGKFCWINKAFTEDGKDIQKIVLSDVRRMAELDVFKNSNEFKKRQVTLMAEAGVAITEKIPVNNFGTLLFEVSQLGLTDGDNLTIETIQAAHEQWIVDDIFFVDPRIPDVGNARQNVMSAQIKKMVKKFGIEKPEKLKFAQTNIYQTPGI